MTASNATSAIALAGKALLIQSVTDNSEIMIISAP